MSMNGTFPKNIRQIGEIPRDKRVYIEDYVMTKITKVHRVEEQPVWYGLLLGYREEMEGSTCFFADGLLEISSLHMEESELERVNGEKETFFPEKELLGVALVCSGTKEDEARLMEELQVFCSAQEEAVIYRFQDEEMEESLYLLRDRQERELSGYYVYYAENPQMQSYLEAHRTEEPGGEAVSDAAIEKFRKKIAEKLEQKKAGKAPVEKPAAEAKPEKPVSEAEPENPVDEAQAEAPKEKKKRPAIAVHPRLPKAGTVLKGAGAAAAIALMIACAALIQNGSRMQKMEEMLDQYAVEAEIMAQNNAALQSENLAMRENQAAQQASAQAAAQKESEEQTGLTESAGEGEMAQAMAGEDEGAADVPLTEGPAEDKTAEDENGSAGDDVALSEETAADETDTVQASAKADETEPDDGAAGEEGEARPVSAPIDAARPLQSSYTIKAGDTLADICTAYYGDLSRLEEICALNHIDDGNMVVPGQKIVLP